MPVVPATPNTIGTLQCELEHIWTLSCLLLRAVGLAVVPVEQ